MPQVFLIRNDKSVSIQTLVFKFFKFLKGFIPLVRTQNFPKN